MYISNRLIDSKFEYKPNTRMMRKVRMVNESWIDFFILDDDGVWWKKNEWCCFKIKNKLQNVLIYIS